MHMLGFSTGSLARGDFRRGIEIVQSLGLKAIELSALREDELEPLVDSLEDLQLEGFDYVSVHAPSKLVRLAEERVVDLLSTFSAMGWPVVLHPDVVKDFGLWRRLGAALCLENMDQRKSTGRTYSELAPFFDQLPEAGLCLDLAHAAQIDPTMTEARKILAGLGERLLQVHVSSIDGRSKHGPLTLSSFLAFKSVATTLLLDVPWILESVVGSDSAAGEVSFVRELATA